MPIKSNCCDSPIAAKCMKCKKVCEVVETFSSVCYTAKPKIGFPHYVTVGHWWWKKRVPFGWEERGEMGEYYDENGNLIRVKDSFCKALLHIGIDESGAFRFCPKCLVKIKP